MMMLEVGIDDAEDEKEKERTELDMTKYTMPARDAFRGVTSARLVMLHNELIAMQREEDSDEDEEESVNEQAYRRAQYKAQRKLAKQQRRRWGINRSTPSSTHNDYDHKHDNHDYDLTMDDHNHNYHDHDLVQILDSGHLFDGASGLVRNHKHNDHDHNITSDNYNTHTIHNSIDACIHNHNHDHGDIIEHDTNGGNVACKHHDNHYTHMHNHYNHCNSSHRECADENCSSKVDCHLHHPRQSSQSRGNWSCSFGLSVAFVSHLLSCRHEWTSDGDDGREVMPPAQGSPLTRLLVIPRVSQKLVDCSHCSTHESVWDMLAYASYIIHKGIPAEGPSGETMGQLKAQGTDPQCSWAGVGTRSWGR